MRYLNVKYSLLYIIKFTLRSDKIINFISVNSIQLFVGSFIKMLMFINLLCQCYTYDSLNFAAFKGETQSKKSIAIKRIAPQRRL